MKYDFSGWATRNGTRCSDGRTIMKNAFAECDGKEVPLVWNHDHGNPENVLGHAVLENREEGVYARGVFNNTERAKVAKSLVDNGDIVALSIYATQVRHADGTRNVKHGNIREVSLVLAGANPGAYIEEVVAHADELGDEAIIYNEDGTILAHSSEEWSDRAPEEKEKNEKVENEQKPNSSEKTVQDVIDSMTEEQKNVLYFIVGKVKEDLEQGGDDDENMGHNAFEDNYDYYDDGEGSILSHSEQAEFLKTMKDNRVSSFREALKSYCESEGILSHGIAQDGDDGIASLFPEPHLLNPGKPDVLKDDETDWVGAILGKITRSPYPKVRTRHIDARKREFEARGYKKGEKKIKREDLKTLGRVTEPQTVYMVDQVHRDDVLSIEDFDYIAFVKEQMEEDYREDMATAIMIGDGRDDEDPYKIHEQNIRPIYKDNALYTIHQKVDIPEMKKSLNGTNTGANFGDDYVYAEAVVQASAYAQLNYKGGKGLPDLYASPELVTKMMMARDLNGRRIYSTRAELASALHVGKIYEIRKFGNVSSEDSEGNTNKLLGIIVNLKDYQLGNVKDGKLTTFDDFDIDFNTYKFLMEGRYSGSLVSPFSAIVLEEPVALAAVLQEPTE